MNSELMNAILAMDSNYGDTYDIPQKGQKGEPGGPSPIAREHTAPPKPNAAPMYLAQRHEGTKMGRPHHSKQTPLVILNLFQDNEQP